MSHSRSKEEMIIEVLAWNLDWDAFDHETGETDLIQWVLRTYRYLERQDMAFLFRHLHQNSLKEVEEVHGSL